MLNNLRQIRRSKDISQEELAIASGVSRQTIIAIEKGSVKRPCDETMIAIAKALGEEVGKIFFTPLVQHVKHDVIPPLNIKSTGTDGGGE